MWLIRIDRASCVAGTISGGGSHVSSSRSAASTMAKTRGLFPVIAQKMPSVAIRLTASGASSSAIARRSTSARLFSSRLTSSTAFTWSSPNSASRVRSASAFAQADWAASACSRCPDSARRRVPNSRTVSSIR